MALAADNEDKILTRRIIDSPKHGVLIAGDFLGYMFVHPNIALANGPDYPDGEDDEVVCPYGQPGDILWVREQWACGKGYDELPPRLIPFSSQPYINRWYLANGPFPEEAGRPRQSIHMPKEICRLRVKILDLRIEQLHDITEQDAKDEGVQPFQESWEKKPSYRSGFRRLWIKLNGQKSWDDNPWVWVIQFKKL